MSSLSPDATLLHDQVEGPFPLWRAVCSNFFGVPAEGGAAPLTMPHSVIQGVMDTFACPASSSSLSAAPVPQAASARSPSDLEAAGEPAVEDLATVTAAVSQLLQRLGFQKIGSSGGWQLDESLRADMEAIKQAVRKEAHKRRMAASTEAYQRELSAALAEHGTSSHCGSGAAGSEEPGIVGASETREDADRKLARVEDFARTWGCRPSSHSFIGGLVAALRAQLRENQYCVAWTIDDAVFVEHEEVAAFSRDAIRLLISSVEFGQWGDVGAQAVLQERDLLASARLSNPRIRAVLARLPREDSLVGGCHGRSRVTSISRVNVAGLLDGDVPAWRQLCDIL